MLDPSIQHLLIVGPGLLGGSIGLALREAGFRGKITGYSRRAATVQTAIDRRCIDEGATDLLAAAQQADLVVLATPVQTLCTILTQFSALDLGDTVLTDVGSTKRSIVTCAKKHLKNPANFVGSHPMAGSEQHGPAAADAKLFAGKPVVLTPCDATDARAVTVTESLWRALGMRVFRMTPDEHDHAVARVSHLPHAVSVMLMLLASRTPGKGMEVASTGLKDVTRLAGGDSEVWADIFFDNASAMLDTLDEWETLVKDFRQMIEQGDRQRLTQWLAEARNKRAGWLRDKP